MGMFFLLALPWRMKDTQLPMTESVTVSVRFVRNCSFRTNSFERNCSFRPWNSSFETVRFKRTEQKVRFVRNEQLWIVVLRANSYTVNLNAVNSTNQRNHVKTRLWSRDFFAKFASAIASTKVIIRMCLTGVRGRHRWGETSADGPNWGLLEKLLEPRR